MHIACFQAYCLLTWLSRFRWLDDICALGVSSALRTAVLGSGGFRCFVQIGLHGFGMVGSLHVDNESNMNFIKLNYTLLYCDMYMYSLPTLFCCFEKILKSRHVDGHFPSRVVCCGRGIRVNEAAPFVQPLLAHLSL